MSELTTKELELTAYKIIRREVNNFQRETDDAELGNFVRGVVALQTELYGMSKIEVEHE